MSGERRNNTLETPSQWAERMIATGFGPQDRPPTPYDSLIAQRDTARANQRMLDLWNLGAIARLTRLEAAVDRRYHLSDELNLTEQVLRRLSSANGYSEPTEEITRLRERAKELRVRLGYGVEATVTDSATLTFDEPAQFYLGMRVWGGKRVDPVTRQATDELMAFQVIG